jgi:hypothetical protein
MAKTYVEFKSVMFGCDPEFFFSKNNKICGSEKILPEKGLTSYGTIVRDGVQAELNPHPNTCRESLAYNIKQCFRTVVNRLEKTGGKIVFDEVVTISKEEMDSLSKESKTFGCAPSLNLYEGEESKIKVNPETYKYRSAGGHIHLGFGGYIQYGSTTLDSYFFSKKLVLNNKDYNGISIHDLKDFEKIKEVLDDLVLIRYGHRPKSTTILQLNNELKVFIEYEKLIYLLDILVGNTGVLLDRNPLSAERRKVYGRAGEFRLTNYGVEYRVLSNFWLKSYTVYSLMFALARFAVCILINDKDNDNTAFYDAIISKVDPVEIETAINKNDFDLAMKNYLKIEDTLCKIVNKNSYHFPINETYKKSFMKLVEKGIPHYFKRDIIDHWLNLNEDSEKNRRIGWERFAETII